MHIPVETTDKTLLKHRLARLRSREISPAHDPWDPYLTAGWTEQPLLTSVEVTVTNQCNLRCEHCAVGDVLAGRDERELTVDELIARIDEVESLVTFSLTGGEPAASPRLVDDVVKPLLRYAKGRGLRTQVNTNLTLPLDRYEAFAEWVDVLHISYNYLNGEEFARRAYAHSSHVPARPAALLERLESNTRELTQAGIFVSAETILTETTLPQIERIHERVARLGCRRHEIHPLYPSDFGAAMEIPPLERLADGVRRLLNHRNPAVWILFGTFPFFACSHDPAQRDLVVRAHNEPNTTIRNDPDGRNRLNVSSLSGDVLVQDFADQGPLGNITTEGFAVIWRRWLASDAARQFHCHCPAARCLGPNLIVAATYYPQVNWRHREALVAVE